MAASFAKTAGQHTRMTRFKPTALLLTLCMSLSVLWHAYHPLQVVGQPSNSYSQPHSQQQNRQQLLESKVGAQRGDSQRRDGKPPDAALHGVQSCHGRGRRQRHLTSDLTTARLRPYV